MDRRQAIGLLKNGVANLITGVSAAIVTLALPAVLVRSLDATAFSLWMLAAQIAFYFNFFSLGFQQSLARFVAATRGDDCDAVRSGMHNLGFRVLSALSAVLMLVVTLVCLNFGRVFPEVPASARNAGAATLFLVSLATAAATPFQLFGSCYVGLQRNEVSALILVASRLWIAGCAALAAWWLGDLLHVAAGFLLATVVALAVQASFMQRSLFPLRSRAPVATGVQRDFLVYVATLSVGAIVSLLQNVVPNTFVASLAFESFAAYTLVSLALTFLLGVYNALLTPLIQIVAGESDKHSTSSGFQHELHRWSLLFGSLLLVGGAWVVFAFRPVATVWANNALAEAARDFVLPLTLATVARSLPGPLAVFIIGSGRQRRVAHLPLFEVAIGLPLTWICGLRFGALGIAYATLGAALCGAALVVIRSGGMAFGPMFELRRYLTMGYVIPVVVSAPAWALALAARDSALHGGWLAGLAAMLAATTALAFLLYRTITGPAPATP